MVELDIMLSLLQTVSIIIGVFYYIMTLQNSNRTQQLALKAQEIAIEHRNTQFFVQLYTSSISEEAIKQVFSEQTWNSFDEWWEIFGPTNNPDAYAKWFKVMVDYEIYGVLLKRGFLDINIIDDAISGGVLMIWDKYRPIIEGIRERMGYPQFQKHQEYLTNEIRKIVNKQHPDYEGKITI